MPGKKGAKPLASGKVKSMAAMIDSDSDSYGSEGGLKEKPVPVKTRGGRKRTTKLTSAAGGGSDRGSDESSGDGGMGELHEGTADASQRSDDEVKPRGRARQAPGQGPNQKQAKNKLLIEKHEEDDSDKESAEPHRGRATKKDREEEKMSEQHSEADQTPKINIQGNVASGQAARDVEMEPKVEPVAATRGRAGRQADSPPMIKEYDPNEENAKTRAEKRRAELKKKRQTSRDREGNRVEMPHDPRAWKGKPVSFFAVHQPRRGTHKVLNNEQKDFILIYYPDSVVPAVSLMEWLYKQAKENDDKERRAKAEKDGVVLRAGKKKRKKQEPADVYRLVHVNEESRDIKHQKALNFESLLEGEAFQPGFAGPELRDLRQHIERIQRAATAQMNEATAFQSQHLQAQELPASLRDIRRRAEPSHQSYKSIASSQTATTIAHGFCPHCHLHSEAPTGSAADEAEVQKQQILRQICAAKQRQARMEAEEARRLKDEARRLAEQAQLLEIEAQRPLLEARRLEQEILEMNAGAYSKLPQRSALGGMPMPTMGPRPPTQSYGASYPTQGYHPQPPQQVLYGGPMRDGLQSQPPSGLGRLYQTEQQRHASVLDQLQRPQTSFEQLVDDRQFNFLDRRDQLLNEARQTQVQIQALKQEAVLLQQQSLIPKTKIDKTVEPEIRGLYRALENPKPRMMVSTNSLAARKAAEERKREQERKEARERQARETELEHYEKLVRERQREAARRAQEVEKAAKANQPKLGRVNPDARSHSRTRREPEVNHDDSDVDQDEDDEEEEKEEYKQRDKSEESKHSEKQSEGQQSDSDAESKSSEESWKPEPAPAIIVEKPKRKPNQKLEYRAKQKQTKQKQKEERLRAGSGTPDRLEDDPDLALANQEFEAAQKAFAKAQLRQQAAKLKKEMEVQQQQAEISKAQHEAKQYFEKEKIKKEEQKREVKAKTINSKNTIKILQRPKAKPKPIEEVEDWQLPDTATLLHRFEQYQGKQRGAQGRIKERYHGRDGCTEFLGPVLSGKILRDFSDVQGYIDFSHYYLEDNFLSGHEEYFRKWRYLFLHETYSFLMNSRWSKFSGAEMNLKNAIQQKQAEKAMCWKGYFQFHGADARFCSLRMLKEPPGFHHKAKNFSKIYEEEDRPEGANFELSHCREDDLIVMSKFRVNLEGGEDIKMVSGGSKFLRELLSRQGVIFGYVRKAAGKLENYVEVLVDGKHQGHFQGQPDADAASFNGKQLSIFTRYCYHFESLLTALREFKAIKQVEFTRLCPVLCYPTLSLEHREKIVEDHCLVVTESFAEYDETPDLYPKVYLEDEERAQLQMNNYLIQNHSKFNTSQSEVLEKIIEMPKDNIMLIQGPPGTGKTHTIIGIISMIMSTRLANSKQKIMVCAPSNAAIDQIIIRIVEKGLIGLQGLKRHKADKKEKKRKHSTTARIDQDSSSADEFYEPPDLTASLIRVSSAEYQTETEIKKHTLEQRIIKKLCIEKFGSLKKCIKDLKEMVKQLNDFDAWDDYQQFPYVNKIKFKEYTTCLKEAYLKTMEGWGDMSMSRSQQSKMMEQQLKLHEKELSDFKTGQNVQQGNPEWKEAEKHIISECNIVCCTLAMAGSGKLDHFKNNFEYLIVDEACQSTEPQTLIPFRHAPKRVILVGDQKQLPATTFSSNSERTGYCRSMFERLLDSGFEKTMLDIQFRMHPKIRAFPSEQFYDGQINDHQSIGYRSAPVTIANLVRLFTSRVIFFDIQTSEEVYDNKSKCNFEEADFTRILIDFIARKMSLQGTLKYVKGQIGVISPYKAQVRQLYQRLEKLCIDQVCSIQDTIEVNTVDAFQGSEKDIIIFNCVRSNSETLMEKSLGFLLDDRRLNVAITRPKYFLMIVGNASTLSKSVVWDNLIGYCQSQGQVIRVPDRSYFETMSDFKKYVVPQFMGDF